MKSQTLCCQATRQSEKTRQRHDWSWVAVVQSSLSDIVHGATSVNRKKNDCRGSCFSQTLQSLEVGYGPITAPSVSVTGASSLICACFRYCHLEKKKRGRGRGRQTRTLLAGAVSQDRRPTRCTASSTTPRPQNKRLSSEDVKTRPRWCKAALTSSETGPPVQNKQRSLPPHSSCLLLFGEEKKKTLGETFRAHVRMENEQWTAPPGRMEGGEAWW